MADVKRTTANRAWGAPGLSFWIFPISAIVAAFVAWGEPGSGFGTRTFAGCAVLVAGGALTALLSAAGTSTRDRLGALLMPVPFLAFFGFLLAGLSEAPDDFLQVAGPLAVALVLFDGSMVVAFRLRVSWTARRGETLFAPAGGPATDGWTRELKRATNNGRASTVIRDYLDDEAGRAHLVDDTTALEARGYEVVSVRHKAAPTGFAAAGRLLSRVVAVILLDLQVDRDRHVTATFRLRSSAREGFSS